MIKVNEKTKIGKEIKKIVDSKYPKLNEYDISFLTSETEERSEYNISIFPNGRIENLRKTINIPLENLGKDAYTFGCIINCLIEESYSSKVNFNLEKNSTTNIEVVFGKKAASSRANENKTYAINSHIQLKELELVLKKKVNLTHSLDVSKENTSFNINGYKFEMDTVKVSAFAAVELAIGLVFS